MYSQVYGTIMYNYFNIKFNTLVLGAKCYVINRVNERRQ